MKQSNFQDQLKKLQQKKELLVILLFLFVIVVFWIGLSIFSSQQTSGILPEQRELAAPLSPDLNVSVIEKLENKKSYDETELSSFPIFIVQSTAVGQSVTTVTTGESEQQSVTLPENLENALESIEEDF